MPKAVEAFRTISEVADDLGIPKHVLRFWEVKFTHIRPMKRGGGRRYYRPEDMELLRGIRYLLHREGYTIKGVQKILKEQGVDAVKVHGLSNDPEPTAAQPKQVSGAAAAPAKRESAKASATATAAEKSSSAARRELIRRAITELEACRAQLGGRPRQPSQVPAASQRKTASGS